MEFKGVTYIENQGITDEATFEAVSEDLAEFYEEINGIVAFQGGLQIRGCVKEPQWNSLYEAWKGEHALYKTYTTLYKEDIPFAQDCMGDQYFLREEIVWRLNGETGETEDLEMDFFEFIDECLEDPLEFLSLHPLEQFVNDGGELHPGELLDCQPPLSEEVPEDTEYLMKAMKTEDRLAWLKKYYASEQ